MLFSSGMKWQKILLCVFDKLSFVSSKINLILKYKGSKIVSIASTKDIWFPDSSKLFLSIWYRLYYKLHLDHNSRNTWLILTISIATKISWGDLPKGTKSVSKQSVFTELLADQLAITKSLHTKLLISQKLLNIIICFNDHYETLFNALLSAINRSWGNKILWRYKVPNICT